MLVKSGGIVMRTTVHVVAVAAFLSSGAQAASVTIDFEEFAIGDGGGSIFSAPVLTSQGYALTGSGGPGGPFTSTEVFLGGFTGGTNAYGGSIGGLGADGYNYHVDVTLERADGGAFAVHNFDLFMDTDSNGWTEIRGQVAGGGLAFLSAASVGTGSWLNLESVRFWAEGDGFGPGLAYVAIDNIEVSAVPLPAAAWLFGSALAGLAWLRRKHTHDSLNL